MGLQIHRYYQCFRWWQFLVLFWNWNRLQTLSLRFRFETSFILDGWKYNIIEIEMSHQIILPSNLTRASVFAGMFPPIYFLIIIVKSKGWSMGTTNNFHDADCFVWVSNWCWLDIYITKTEPTRSGIYLDFPRERVRFYFHYYFEATIWKPCFEMSVWIWSNLVWKPTSEMISIGFPW